MKKNLMTTSGNRNLDLPACSAVPHPTAPPAVCLRNINPLNAELNLICHLLALLGANNILHISRIRVKPVQNDGLVTDVSILFSLLICFFFWMGGLGFSKNEKRSLTKKEAKCLMTFHIS